MSAVSMNGIVKKKTVNKSVKKKKRPTAMKGKAKKPILAQLMAKKTVNGLGERDRTGRFTGTGSAKKSEKAPAPRASTAAPKSFPPALRVPRVASSPPPPAKSPHPGIALPFPKVAVPYPNMLENSGFMGTVGVEAGEKFGQYVTAMLNTLRPERKRQYMKAIRRTIAELDLQAADQDSDVEMV
ncbi:uncharacterized protein LOC129602416 isoform X2 [Paramacrobiotus metropolitanus]|uniref:uncharacterized protein LOC129602416 isoform X2 n=1 Tax=Paramacrobiotus metropolitanus TaxID=2943436 RepID=UPI002445DB8D|nr:uncharacterized protein LOC129602416 isoform X2 [Paramacrobiotus metropolitanus]